MQSVQQARAAAPGSGVSSMALITKATFLAGAAFAAFTLSGPVFAQQRLGSVFTVANVSAEAEAANSVEAKKLATQTAEGRAFQLLVGRLTDFRAATRLPELPQGEIEALVSDIATSGEGVSATNYVANFSVSFSERAVMQLFARNGIVPILDRGPEILIIPVFVEDGAAVTSDRNPWRTALLRLDLAHALVPAKVAPVRSDLGAAVAKAYAANPAAAVETLKAQYHTGQLMLALAEYEGGSDAISLKLAGDDSTGLLTLQRKVKVKDGTDETIMQTAARLAFDTIQERWKLTRNAYTGPVSDAGSGVTPAFSGGSGFASVQLTAQFSSLKEWQAIRSRLQSIPGMQNWDLRSVNPRSAEIGFDFPGGAERLIAMAASQGLTVEKGPEGLVVKTR